MIIYLSIFAIILFAIGFVMLPREKSKKFPWKSAICTVLTVAIAVTLPLVYINSELVDGAEKQCSFYKSEDCTFDGIYYDAEEDYYFVIKYSQFDLTNLFYRARLNYEKAIVYIKAMEEINLQLYYG